jgi:hypothetical protein
MQTNNNVDETQFPPDDSVPWVQAKGIAVPLEHDKCVALGMGMLGRLGAFSPLKILGTDLLQLIVVFAATHCSVPDLRLPKFIDKVLYNFVKENKYGLDYTIHRNPEATLFKIRLPEDGHILICDAGPRRIFPTIPNVAAADTASNAAMYGDNQLALSRFNPGNVTVQFKHEIFQEHTQRWSEDDHEDLTLLADFYTGWSSGMEYTGISYNIADGNYTSLDINWPESRDYVKNLMRELLRITGPLIKAHWETLPAEKRVRLLAGPLLNGA